MSRDARSGHWSRADASNQFAQELFAGLPRHYDVLGYLLSFGQDRRWRRAMLGALDLEPGDVVLDVATGTGGVALDLRRATGARVIGVDLSEPMLARASERLARERVDGITLVRGRAESLPFRDGAFDALSVTYLLRYVDDPGATLRELARVLKDGGVMTSMEFFVPPKRRWRALWWCYTRSLLPLAGLLTGGAAWRRAGSFLGPSISSFYRRHPLDNVVAMWHDAGLTRVRTRILSLGGGVVITAIKDAGA